jgi:prophage antirepressor-like protein
MNTQGLSVPVMEGAAHGHLLPLGYEGRQVRVITDKQGAPWFVAADVCAVLDLGNPSQVLARLDDDEKTLISNECQGQGQAATLNTVNEPGLYSLILGSRKPEARAFKRWVTHEVLPAIRSTGSYGTTPTLTSEDVERICTGVIQRVLRTEPRRRAPWASLSPISTERLEAAIPWCDPLTSAEILEWLDLPNTRANQMAVSTGMRSLGYTRHRFMINGKRHWIYCSDRPDQITSAPTPQLPPGIHVVANNQRHANWLWGLAVEEHVSRALMSSIASNGRRRRTDPAYQLHLLPPAS